jgi:23S rRNA (guanosine2251-2'-O)-methyltransferase
VAVDGVTDPQNLGALLRTAECAGATGVVLPRHRSAHVTPTVTKAAAGAVEHLPWALVAGLASARARLMARGVWRVGLAGAGDASVFDLAVATEPLALVLGAEGRGLARLVKERCDVLAAIPLRGHLGSLNVSAAAAIACFEVARRR